MEQRELSRLSSFGIQISFVLYLKIVLYPAKNQWHPCIEPIICDST